MAAKFPSKANRARVQPSGLVSPHPLRQIERNSFPAGHPTFQRAKSPKGDERINSRQRKDAPSDSSSAAELNFPPLVEFNSLKTKRKIPGVPAGPAEHTPSEFELDPIEISRLTA